MTVGVAHTHHRLVEIEALMVESAPLVAVHHIVVSPLRVETLGSWSVCRERRYAVGETLTYEVVAKIHVVVLPYGRSYVHGTRPVAAGNDFKHHHIVLVESRLALQRDDHTVWYRVAGHHHAAASHSLLVYLQIERVGGNDMQVGVAGAHPVLHYVAHVKRVVAKLRLGSLWVRLVEVEYLLLCLRLHAHILIRSRAVVEPWPRYRQCGRVVCRTLHLVYVPVGLHIREVAYACISAHALHFLIVPQRERVVIAIGEYHGIALILKSHEVVLTEVAASIAVASVVVVPRL